MVAKLNGFPHAESPLEFVDHFEPFGIVVAHKTEKVSHK